VNLTIASITLRGLLGRKRLFLLLPLPALLMGLAWLADGLGASPHDWVGPIVGGLGFAVVLPVMALIVGTGVLGSEIDDGTVVHILTKPLPRTEIILAKLAVATGVTATVAGVPLLVVGLIAGDTRLGLGLLVAAITGSFAYCGLFLALSLLTRRPVLVGLAYVLLWEGLLTNLISGTRLLSVQQNVIAIADAVSGSDLIKGSIGTALAVGTVLVFAVGGTLLAIDRLRSFSVAGETS